MKKTKDTVVTNSDEEDDIFDEDTCSEAEIQKMFKTTYTKAHEQSINLKRNYILHLEASSNFNNLCASSSDNSINMYKIAESSFENIILPSKFVSQYDGKVCGLRFFNNDENMLLCGLENGKVHLIDLRTYEIIHTFEDNSNEKGVKPITSFDINQNNRILCTGTGLIQGDAFLLFYDIRERALLGGYWESHTDDITQIKFHPSNPNFFASGSTDGLINVFDISKTSEDDALQSCYNTVSSVDKINWHKNIYDRDVLSIITHTNDLHIYNVEDAEALVTFDRGTITKVFCRKSSDDCILIDCHNSNTDEIITLVQSNFNNGECVRGTKLENKTLVPLINFKDNKQIIRTSVYNSLHDVFFTAGESGMITMFKPTNRETELSSNLDDKFTSKCKLSINQSTRIKPY